MEIEYHAVLSSGEEIIIDGSAIDSLDLTELGEGAFHIISQGKSYRVQVLKADHTNKQFTIRVNGDEIDIKLRDAVETMVHAMGLDEVAAEPTNVVLAPMPGLVLDLRTSVGEPVSEGEPLVILEAMKMENVLAAPCDGIVSELNVRPGQAVDKGQVLVVVDPLGS